MKIHTFVPKISHTFLKNDDLYYFSQREMAAHIFSEWLKVKHSFHLCIIWRFDPLHY